MLHKNQLILAVLAVISGGVFWFFIPQPFYALVLLVFYAAFLGLGFLLLPSWVSSLVVLLSSLPIFLFFRNYFLASGAILFLSLLTLFPALRVKNETGRHLKFSLIIFLRKGLPLFFTFFALALAALLYPAGEEITFEDILPRELIIPILPSFAEPELLYQNALGFFEARFGAYEKYLPAVFAFGTFIVLRTLFIVVGWMSMALAWLIFKLLLYSGTFVLATRPVAQEYLILK